MGRRDNAIDRGLLDPTLTEGVVAAHTIRPNLYERLLDPTLTEGVFAAHTIRPNLYERLLDRHDISEEDVERTIDAFLTGFAR